jgi:hypothetical protein
MQVYNSYMFEELTQAIDQFLQKPISQYLESEIWGLLHASINVEGVLIHTGFYSTF